MNEWRVLYIHTCIYVFVHGSSKNERMESVNALQRKAISTSQRCFGCVRIRVLFKGARVHSRGKSRIIDTRCRNPNALFMSLLQHPSYMAHCRHPLSILSPTTFFPSPPHITTTYRPSASLSNPSKSTLFGLSIGSPNARSQTSCASGPNPRDTPNVAV